MSQKSKHKNPSKDRELFPLVSSAAWAKQYGLKIKTVKCEGCNRRVKLNRPWATLIWRGFVVSSKHRCASPTRKFTGIMFDENGNNVGKMLADALLLCKGPPWSDI
jgi:hypothetical protein